MTTSLKTPKFAISHADEYGARVFFTDATGRGLFLETDDGRNPQMAGTLDAGPFGTEAAFRAYVAHRFES